jgi:hyperosmotically inducible protein
MTTIGFALILSWTIGVAQDTRAEAAEQPRQEAAASVTDAWITTKIQAAYFLDEDVKALNLHVTTRDGIVTLTGTIANERERQEAVSIAKTTDGVKEVVDKLTITAASEPVPTTGTTPNTRKEGERLPASDELSRLRSTDPVILATIKAQLALDPMVSALAIDVDVDDGVVTLQGDVEDEAAHARAVSIARAVAGVKEVRDRLDVRQ